MFPSIMAPPHKIDFVDSASVVNTISILNIPQRIPNYVLFKYSIHQSYLLGSSLAMGIRQRRRHLDLVLLVKLAGRVNYWFNIHSLSDENLKWMTS